MKKVLSCTLVLFALLVAQSAAAATPSLSVAATGTGDQAVINVSGDANQSVLLFYTKQGSGLTIETLGTINSNGSFSATVYSSSLGLTSGSQVYVRTGGTAGPQSNTVSWPVSAESSVKLNQSSVVVSAGASATVTAEKIGSGLYISNNSNPSIANVSVSGSTITVSGNITGTTNVTICSIGATGNCPTLYVIVQAPGSSQLSFSQNSATVVSGQTLPITISGGNGSYSITNNSNSNVIQASISGSVLSLSTGSTSGSATITVCTSDMAHCGIVNVSAGNASSVSVSFSSNAPSVAAGQSTNVNIYGPSGVQFYVSSNSSPNKVQANLSGSTLSLTGIAAGTSEVKVCSSTGNCATLTATVANASSNASISLSQNTLSLQPGQNTNITVTGGDQPYALLAGNNSIAQGTLNGNILTVNGIAAGATLLSVCSAGGGCTNLSVTIGNAGTVTSTPSNTNTSSGSTYTPPTTPIYVPPVITPVFTFTSYLKPGSEGTEVTELQKILHNKGYLSVSPTGYYGQLTVDAVVEFQADNGIDQLGVVGPSTRAALNKIAGSASSSSGSTNIPSSASIATMSVAELKAQAQALSTLLAQILARITALGGQ